MGAVGRNGILRLVWCATISAMRIVAHVDMDAFFAAVEERYNPQFRGLPIVVGADPKQGKGRGVVSTASYAARKYGIHSAMPITRAWRLSEEARQRGQAPAVFLTGQFSLYNEVSQRIMAILAGCADAFEQASVDEAYLEWKYHEASIENRGDEWVEIEKLAKEVQQEIFAQEKLTCSVGIGPNKLVAKIASDFKKPGGLTIVRPEEVEMFLAPMSIRAIPGIGPKGEQFLNQKNIRTIGGLQKISEADLTKWLGKWGMDLFQKARGISGSQVSNDWVAKSIGEEETFQEDTREAAFVLDRATTLADYVFRRLREEGFASFRTVVVKVRFSDFTTLTRSHTAPKPLATVESLRGEMLRLFLPFLDQRENPQRKKIRLIGVRVEKLVEK